MSDIIKYQNIESKLIPIREQRVLIDKDVADIYGVETKRVNEAVKNNPDKFPKDYLFELSNKEFDDLRSKFSTTKFSKTRVAPKAFTEKGLYMIATMLHQINSKISHINCFFFSLLSIENISVAMAMQRFYISLKKKNNSIYLYDIMKLNWC